MQEIYLKTGEEAIYCQYLINDIIPPKFILYIFESNDENIIEGKLTMPLNKA